MPAGWLQFGRRRRTAATTAHDNAVTGLRLWLMGAVVIASSAALLGTSDDSPSTPQAKTYTVAYTFERQGIDGGSAKLTRDQPNATFFVTITATGLGPDGVSTIENAVAKLDGTVTQTGLTAGATSSSVSVKINTLQGIGSMQQVQDSFVATQPLTFSDSCADATSGGACTSRFEVDLWRVDDGASDGTVQVDWLFDVASSAQQLTYTEAKATAVGPLDPPWTIEVTQQ